MPSTTPNLGRSAALVILLLCLPGLSPAWTQDVIRDDFETGTLGGLPGPAAIGNRFIYGNTSDHQLVDHEASMRLESSDGSTTDGFAVQWFPTENPVSFRVTWEGSVEAASGQAVMSNDVTVSTTGTNTILALRWDDTDGTLVLSVPGGFIDVGTWFLQTTYRFQLDIDCGADVVSLRIDDAATSALASPLGVDCSALHSVSFGSVLPYTVTHIIDNVRVESLDVFRDGFESGNTSAWVTVPPPCNPSC